MVFPLLFVIHSDSFEQNGVRVLSDRFVGDVEIRKGTESAVTSKHLRNESIDLQRKDFLITVTSTQFVSEPATRIYISDTRLTLGFSLVLLDFNWVKKAVRNSGLVSVSFMAHSSAVRTSGETSVILGVIEEC
jgi:hypothetical protein